MKNPGRLGRAAEVCAATWAPSNEEDFDFTVDLRGWKPTPRLIDGPGLPGIAGVLQAQHNLLVHLTTFPDAMSLRIVLDSQRVVSRETAKRLARHDQSLAATWEGRADAYGRLVKETRTSAAGSATVDQRQARAPSPPPGRGSFPQTG